MKYKLLNSAWLLFFFLTAVCPTLLAQQEGFIYGEVIMKDDTRYKGKITWGAGQSMWTDMIIAEKKDNPMLKYLNAEELKKLSEEEKRKQTDWGFMTLWKNQYPSRKLALRCQFGNIGSIQVTGSKDADITLKNGERIRVFINEDQEYKDQLGKNIRIQTYNDKFSLDWQHISEIVFMNFPADLPQFTEVPLYGTVLTKTGFTYTGLIKWDMYEHLTSQYLNGKTKEDKKIRYIFKEVKGIRPKDEGSLVQLKSGAEVYLHDYSNVTKKNKGILIRDPFWGQVIVRWSDFKMATFTSYPSDSKFEYAKFKTPLELTGRVTTINNNKWSGKLVYDLDEKLDIETLDGWDKGGALRQVPFRLIAKIYPVSKSHTAVVLKNGEKLVLGERSDVDFHNWGIMVKLPGEQFKYVPWDKLKLIEFDQ